MFEFLAVYGPEIVGALMVAVFLPPLLWFVLQQVCRRVDGWIRHSTDTVYFGDPKLKAAVRSELERTQR